MATNTLVKPTWRHWIEPWYLAYGLIGIVAAGILPILLPQYIGSVQGTSQVGLVLAVYNLGGFTSIIWGQLVSRGWIRPLVVASLVSFTLGLTLILLAPSLPLLVLMALILGSSLNALTTGASVWIMKSFDQFEWDERISWMMTTFQIGQVVGLVIIGFLIDLTPQVSFYVSIGISCLSLLMVLRLIRPELNDQIHHFWTSRRHLRSQVAHLPIPATPPHFHLGLINREHMGHIFRTRFGWLILGNVLQGIAAAFIYTLFPLLYFYTFNVDPAVSSLLFGAATVVTIVIFPMAGQMTQRWGSIRIVQLALLARCLSCLGLLVLALVDLPGRSALAVLLFGFIVCAWPFIGIGFTLAIPQVSTLEQGEAIGIFNASTAVANTLGAVVAGLAAALGGYDSLPLFGFVVMAVAVGSLLRLPNRSAA